MASESSTVGARSLLERGGCVEKVVWERLEASSALTPSVPAGPDRLELLDLKLNGTSIPANDCAATVPIMPTRGPSRAASHVRVGDD